MSYRTEFPDFVLDVEIPEGFTDESWRNDVCPRFDKQLPNGSWLVLWVDYLDPNDREYTKEKRFAVALKIMGTRQRKQKSRRSTVLSCL